MHEYGIVAEMIDKLAVQFHQAQIAQVEWIHFRRGIDFYEDSLRDAFAAYSVGTPLEGATVVIDSATVSIQCDCGNEGTISVEQLIGRFWVCPHCEKMHYIENIPDLEVLEV